MAKVKVIVGFSSGHAGSRDAGETFDYDVAGDPAGLVAEGKVEVVKEAAAVKVAETK
jgi:hypothetical protein